MTKKDLARELEEELYTLGRATGYVERERLKESALRWVKARIDAVAADPSAKDILGPVDAGQRWRMIEALAERSSARLLAYTTPVVSPWAFLDASQRERLLEIEGRLVSERAWAST